MLKNEGKNTKNTITYRQVGDYLIPNLTLPPEEKSVVLGKWGMMYKDYLMKNKRAQFDIMLTKGTLFQHIADIDRQAEELFSRLVDDMAKAEGITEELKAIDQLEWVRRMNNINTRARDIVYKELIYV